MRWHCGAAHRWKGAAGGNLFRVDLRRQMKCDVPTPRETLHPQHYITLHYITLHYITLYYIIMFIKRVYANSEIFYSYIYGAVVEVTVDTAPDIVYAAMKYMLPALVRHCGVCLSEGLNVNNVIQVLETSFIIDDTE